MKKIDQRPEITFQCLFIIGAWDKWKRYGVVVYVLVEELEMETVKAP